MQLEGQEAELEKLEQDDLYVFDWSRERLTENFEKNFFERLIQLGAN